MCVVLVRVAYVALPPPVCAYVKWYQVSLLLGFCFRHGKFFILFKAARMVPFTRYRMFHPGAAGRIGTCPVTTGVVFGDELM